MAELCTEATTTTSIPGPFHTAISHNSHPISPSALSSTKPADHNCFEPVEPAGFRIIPGSGQIKACRVEVNGALLEREDLPKFYTWLRQREYLVD